MVVFHDGLCLELAGWHILREVRLGVFDRGVEDCPRFGVGRPSSRRINVDANDLPHRSGELEDLAIIARRRQEESDHFATQRCRARKLIEQRLHAGLLGRHRRCSSCSWARARGNARSAHTRVLPQPPAVGLRRRHCRALVCAMSAAAELTSCQYNSPVRHHRRQVRH